LNLLYLKSIFLDSSIIEDCDSENPVLFSIVF
jgi:hypothetical protein